jgi:predicted permease
MTQLAGILKICIFILLGILFRKSNVLDRRGIEGIKKAVLYLAIPAVLFLSFSRQDFNLGFLHVTIIILLLNLVLFWGAFLFVRISGGRLRLLPLLISTMNFSLIGIPLYEALHGYASLHNYTIFGLGNELYNWFIFFFLLKWYLSGGRAKEHFNASFLSSPIVWSIILGCLFGILGIELETNRNFLVMGISEAVIAASRLTTPLILVFIGYNISLSSRYLKRSLGYTSIRLIALYILGYLTKILLLDRLVDMNASRNAAYFLFISLPPVFSMPLLADEYLDEEETVLLNNTIVLHTIAAMVLFSVFSFVTGS